MAKKTDDERTFHEVPAPRQAPEPLHPEQAAVNAAVVEKAGAVVQQIALDAFCLFKFGSKNFDQSAGFKRWCSGKGLHTTRFPEAKWASLFDEFQNRRIG